MKKRTVTTIETHQIVIVRRPAGATLAQCPACGKEVEMVPLGDASLLNKGSLGDGSAGADTLSLPAADFGDDSQY